MAREPLLHLSSSDYVELLLKNKSLAFIANRYFYKRPASPVGPVNEVSDGSTLLRNISTTLLTSHDFKDKLLKLIPENSQSQSIFTVTESDANFIALYTYALCLWVIIAMSSLNKIQSKNFTIYSTFGISLIKSVVFLINCNTINTSTHQFECVLDNKFVIDDITNEISERKIDQLRISCTNISNLEDDKLTWYIRGWLPEFLSLFKCQYKSTQAQTTISNVDLIELVQQAKQDLAFLES